MAAETATHEKSPHSHKRLHQDIKERINDSFTRFWEQFWERYHTAQPPHCTPRNKNEQSRGQREVRGKSLGTATASPLTPKPQSPPGLKVKPGNTRQHRPHKRRPRQRKHKQTTRPSVTPMRGRNSDYGKYRVRGRWMQDLIPTWGKKVTLNSTLTPAAPRGPPAGADNIPTEGIG
ncbi:Hypothetical predicted protein [Pelobates cultripes]|uniref:Uncharacterized protein n=1 Tax=Pelobates cultripes TaxID=61616 RepID=A0AAD1WB65_PELCU|nr:Hypothetical predicted protein [Pelobates cultripes]